MRKLLKLLRYKRHTIDPRLLLALEALGFVSLLYLAMTNIGHFVDSIRTMYVFGFAIIAGNHRLFAHNSWPCPKWLSRLILIISTLSLHGPVLAWVAVHRQHHHLSDQRDDPHSPNFKSKWWVQFASYNYTPDLRYSLDLYKDKWQRAMFDFYWIINISFAALLYFIEPVYVIVWLAGSFLAQMQAFAVNTFCHSTPKWLFPTKETGTKDTSRNVPILALLNGGEGWHLNHHNKPWKWYFGEKWWQFDLTGVQIFVTLLFINPAYLLEIYKKRKHNVITN
jgi:fatty-acid desaturase